MSASGPPDRRPGPSRRRAVAGLPGCTSVIAGAASAEQVRANAAASDWIPEPDDLTEISKIAPRP